MRRVRGHAGRIEELLEHRACFTIASGVGQAFVQEAVKSGRKNARGIVFTQAKKEEMMVYLKQKMQNGAVHIPFDREFINMLNVEGYQP